MDDAYDHDHAHYHAARTYIYFLELHLWELMAGVGPRADGDGCCYFLVIVLVLTALFTIPSGFVVLDKR